jgi:hypothetical protein
MAGKWIFDWFNKKKNEEKKGKFTPDKGSSLIDAAKSRVNAGTQSDYDALGQQMADRMRQVAVGGVTADEYESSSKLVSAVEAAVARKAQAYQADVGVGGVTNPDVLNARTAELRTGTALIAVMKGELAKLQDAVKDGTKQQVKVIGNNALQDRMAESVHRQTELAMRPATVTYGE